MTDLKAEISKAFKLHGFQLRLEARNLFQNLLSDLEDAEERNEWIDKVLDRLQKKGLESAVVDKTLLSQAIQECSKEEVGREDEENVFNVIDAFRVPRFTYSVDRKKYLPDKALNKPEPLVYAGAESKAELFRSRYQMLHQRTSRHDLFTPAVAGTSDTKKKFQLKKVEYLLGTTNKLSDVIVLGMLTQIKTGKYSLEDTTGVVGLDLSEAKFQSGLYTEGCFVLVEGWYEDFVFHVIAMGFPPMEPSTTTRAFFGNINFFGGPLKACAKSNVRLAEVEKANADAMFVFLSDVWLDRANVVERLRKLFAGYASLPPTCFVLMGNFLFSPYGSNQAKVLRDHFRILGEIVAEHPEILANSKFVFIPGPSDPGYANIFPRPGLPKFITEEFRKRVPDAYFATNPARIQYCTQEIILFREDIVTKMCRNCIYFPESGDIPNHFAKTVLSQGHLAPLPLHICPVYWDFDRSMGLYPLPDLIVIGDKFDPFTASQVDCQVLNPGSFAKNEFSFKTYVPKLRLIEESQVPDEDME